MLTLPSPLQLGVTVFQPPVSVLPV
jgi:hypothetical protein